MVKIKICGITNLEDAKLSVAIGADALGFVFAESPRKIRPALARTIIKQLPAFVVTVGVFVNQKIKFIEEMIDFCHFHAVQLHGEESPEFCKTLRVRSKVIKAFRIKDASVLDKINRYKVDGYLLDTFTDSVFGGTGKTFDWKIASKTKKLLGNRPLILSGGLNAENVKRAIIKVNPYAVDVSTGVEKYPGKKDVESLRNFVDKVRTVKWEKSKNKNLLN